LTNRAYRERESQELQIASWGISVVVGRTDILDLTRPWQSFATHAPTPTSSALAGPLIGARAPIGEFVNTLTRIPIPSNSDSQLLAGLELQMTQYSAEFERDMERLRRDFVLLNQPQVEHFLRDHRSLIEVLLDAVAALRRCFGQDAVLQIRMGGTEDEAPITLCCVVQWKGSADLAKTALDAFDEIWWMTNVKRASGRIVIDYELA